METVEGRHEGPASVHFLEKLTSSGQPDTLPMRTKTPKLYVQTPLVLGTPGGGRTL